MDKFGERDLRQKEVVSPAFCLVENSSDLWAQFVLEVPNEGNSVNNILRQRVHSLRSFRKSFSKPSPSTSSLSMPRRLGLP